MFTSCSIYDVQTNYLLIRMILTMDITNSLGIKDRRPFAKLALVPVDQEHRTSLAWACLCNAVTSIHPVYFIVL